MNELLANDSPANEEETRAELLNRSRRDATPIRKTFVQRPLGSEERPGPLADFVRGRDLRALQAFLIVLAASSSPAKGWGTTLPIRAWARAFGTTLHATPVSATSAASKVLARLERRKLIERHRVGRSRQVKIVPLREDGTGAKYSRPGAGNSDRFLKLPHAYWLDGWYKELDLPATAMLLVVLAEPNGFALPTEKVPDWYGWSADTAERGFKTLQEFGLLRVHRALKKAPLSPTGLAEVNHYFRSGPLNPLANLSPAVAAADGKKPATPAPA